ncbi:MAG TPA: Flp family type IVb pilin [Stellaceae bacterium]|nr:Flp family type IVb pilin [Stellaceae bacterium]HEV2334086.1 Flp family type IVb pilin [Stellaceae bacterium]
MGKIIERLIKDRSGSNALEYGLIVALVSLAVVAGAAVAGTDLGALFNAIGATISSVTAGI